LTDNWTHTWTHRYMGEMQKMRSATNGETYEPEIITQRHPCRPRDVRTFATKRIYAVIMSDSSLLTLFLNGVMTYLGGRCGIRRERTPPIRNN
ncbi:hypothetical protein BD309DRAFT_972210, partial [Dichomitus squalens]